LVDIETGEEKGVAVKAYPHCVIYDKLPNTDIELPADFALQHAQDYLDCGINVIKETIKNIPGDNIIGVAVDFTACTVIPVKKDGTPLMFLDEFKDNPHAWVKLWKHHAAQAEADKINELAHKKDEQFLKYYSGIVSSEWILPKCWETANHAIDVYNATDYFLDAGDWMVQQLTGEFTRNACAAGYKGLWSEELGSPSKDFLKALDPKIENLNDKLVSNIIPAGKPAGKISAKFAKLTGLKEKTVVSVATIDAHSGVPGMGVCKTGVMSLIMGTSSCHLLMSDELKLFNGYAGVVKDGILPGFYGYESGQSAVGDIFAWFVKIFMPNLKNPFKKITAKAELLPPGANGLIALDWHNGNRSVLMNADLSGLILGLNINTKTEEIYRALVESTGFGTKVIIDSYIDNGIKIKEIVACGGLTKDEFLMQIYTDILQIPIKVAATTQAVALGSAIFAAVAAGKENGGYDSIDIAVKKMTKPFIETFEPNVDLKDTYQTLFDIYKKVHDFFGQDNPELMKTLKNVIF
jgi:L-ribulokinase